MLTLTKHLVVQRPKRAPNIKRIFKSSSIYIGRSCWIFRIVSDTQHNFFVIEVYIQLENPTRPRHFGFNIVRVPFLNVVFKIECEQMILGFFIQSREHGSFFATFSGVLMAIDIHSIYLVVEKIVSLALARSNPCT